MAARPTISEARSTLPGRFYTRLEFAKKVGVSPWYLQRLHYEGTFPAYSAGHRGRGGAAQYHESQIAKFRELPDKVEAHDFKHNALYDAATAQACFKAFDEGRISTWCVTELGIHPDIVEAIWLRYEGLRQGILLPSNLVARINALTTLEGRFPLQNGEDVVDLITRAAEALEDAESRLADMKHPTCASCKRTGAAYCKGCVSETTRAFYDQGCKETLDKVRTEMAAMAASEPQKAEGAPAEAKTPPVAPEAERQGPKKTRKRV